ncbi:hypothetical protein BDV36DRAFT_59937 [Aspergillus pseudocaelatus]|uniref:Uncharacterized protein n=1 Tax=Aspergillus pseudocaelatus TaxID=1825620 RepID=A0ABQ6WWQ2_9EURO|nr:hypothetical protein BDV36DRAFT_59937 [Aspergillus pseudocaelatus]
MSEQIQMDVDPRPMPAAPNLPEAQQSSTIDSDNLIFQQSHLASHHPNNQSDAVRMDVDANDFNPRPYLLFTPTPAAPNPPEAQQPSTINSGYLIFQQPHLALPPSNYNHKPGQLNTATGDFDPRPYLQYTPVSTPHQSNQETADSSQDLYGQQPCVASHTQPNHYHHSRIDAPQHTVNPQANTSHRLVDVYTDRFCAQQQQHPPHPMQGWGNHPVGQLGPGHPEELNGLDEPNQPGNHWACSRRIVGFA